MRELRIAFIMIKRFCEQDEIRVKLDVMYADVHGDTSTPKYRLMITDLLGQQIYPSILRRLGLPDDQQPLQMTLWAMRDTHEDFDNTFRWFDTEVQMRNQAQIQNAFSNLANHARERQLPLPSIDELMKDPSCLPDWAKEKRASIHSADSAYA